MRLPEHLFPLAFVWFAFDFKSPFRAFGLSRQMESGEDCLSAESASSAAAHLRR